MTGIALLPPLSMADYFLDDDHYAPWRPYYLYLPQLLHKKHYDRFVWRSNTKIAYTILDNGAYEGEAVSPEGLLDLARELNVNEVVAPDVLKDCNATLEAVGNFSDLVYKQRHNTDYRPEIMGVVQGTSIEDCLNCAVGLTSFSFITSLALPKHLTTTITYNARIMLVQKIRALSSRRYPIHFLGGAPIWPKEVIHAKALGVRSMDTSMPFVQAYYGKHMDEPPLMERPEHYFDTPLRAFNMRLVRKNIETLQEWGNGY